MIPAGIGPGAEFTFGNHLIELKKGQTEKAEDGTPSELLAGSCLGRLMGGNFWRGLELPARSSPKSLPGVGCGH